jgi:hypothetical protein
MTAASKPHFRKIFKNFCSLPALTQSTMRSCDSDKRISYGVMVGSRRGTSSMSRAIPTPPRAAISAGAVESPPAPKSCSPISSGKRQTSNVASIRDFAVNGSPTWTLGRRSSVSPTKSSEANVAPWIPSRPVAAPTTRILLPTPAAIARFSSDLFTNPTHITFTKQLSV